MNILRFLSTVCILTTLVPAYAQFEVVHDASHGDLPSKPAGLILQDGSTVTHHIRGGQSVFRKYDVQGALEWSRSLQAYYSYYGKLVELLPDGLDGFQVVRRAGTEIQVIDEFNASFLCHIQAFRVNGSGQITEAIKVVKEFVEEPTSGSGLLDLTAARTATGGLILGPLFTKYSTGSTDLLHLESTGTIAWARSIGSQLGMSAAFPTFNPTFAEVQQCFLQQGRINYIAYEPHFGEVLLAALDMSGELEWMQRYNYNNTMGSYFGSAPDGTGGVYVGGNINTGVGLAAIIVQVGANGELNRADLYPATGSAYQGDLVIDPAGRRILRWDSYGPYPTQILIADTLGSPGRWIRPTGVTIPPHQVRVLPDRIDIAGDKLAVRGSLRYQHMDLGNTFYYDVVGRYAVDEIVPCLMDDTLVQHIPVPFNLINIAVPENLASLDVSAYYSSSPITLTWSDTDPGELEDLCTFIGDLIGSEVGIAERAGENAPWVVNTLVPQGGSILFMNDDILTVEVHDMHGALVQRTTLNGARSLGTNGWPSGVYLLRAMPRDGSYVRVARVVVE